MRQLSAQQRTSVVMLAAAGAVLALAACGEPEADAVSATEQNSVELGGIDYRVSRFRQLNPRIAPDRAIVPAPPPRGGRAYYAAFLTVCNRADTTRTPTSRIHLEDAFGAAFAPVAPAQANVFAYRPRPLMPGACVPVEASPAEQTVGGAALVFELPNQAVQERPLILELSREPGGSGRAAARVQLDL